jgi:hypothetical protein
VSAVQNGSLGPVKSSNHSDSKILESKDKLLRMISHQSINHLQTT